MLGSVARSAYRDLILCLFLEIITVEGSNCVDSDVVQYIERGEGVNSSVFGSRKDNDICNRLLIPG